MGCDPGLMDEWHPLTWGQKHSQPSKVLATGHILATPHN